MGDLTRNKPCVSFRAVFVPGSRRIKALMRPYLYRCLSLHYGVQSAAAAGCTGAKQPVIVARGEQRKELHIPIMPVTLRQGRGTSLKRFAWIRRSSLVRASLCQDRAVLAMAREHSGIVPCDSDQRNPKSAVS